MEFSGPKDEPTDVGDPLYEREVTSERELLKVLRELRRRLLEHDEIVAAVRSCRRPISTRDFHVTLAALVGGTLGQAFAVANAPILIPLFLFVQVAAIAGITSLAHEAWHKRSHPNPTIDQWMSRWIIGPVTLTNNLALARDHWAHHAMAGEPADPSNVTWAQSEHEFRLSVLSRLLILPSLAKSASRLITGKRPDVNLSEERPDADLRTVVGIILLHSVWAGCLLLVSLPALIIGWVIPLPIGAAMAHLREYREHARMSDGRTAVFDILCNEAERVLIPGGYFNLHALHHLFPEIPQRNLPRLYRTIESVVDMERDYYGFSPQIGLKRSYLKAYPVPS